MWETEEKVVNGRKLTVYKGTHNSLRDFWKWTEVSIAFGAESW